MILTYIEPFLFPISKSLCYAVRNSIFCFLGTGLWSVPFSQRLWFLLILNPSFFPLARTCVNYPSLVLNQFGVEMDMFKNLFDWPSWMMQSEAHWRILQIQANAGGFNLWKCCTNLSKYLNGLMSFNGLTYELAGVSIECSFGKSINFLPKPIWSFGLNSQRVHSTFFSVVFCLLVIAELFDVLVLILRYGMS